MALIRESSTTNVQVFDFFCAALSIYRNYLVQFLRTAIHFYSFEIYFFFIFILYARVFWISHHSAPAHMILRVTKRIFIFIFDIWNEWATQLFYFFFSLFISLALFLAHTLTCDHRINKLFAMTDVKLKFTQFTLNNALHSIFIHIILVDTSQSTHITSHFYGKKFQ